MSQPAIDSVRYLTAFRLVLYSKYPRYYGLLYAQPVPDSSFTDDVMTKGALLSLESLNAVLAMIILYHSLITLSSVFEKFLNISLQMFSLRKLFSSQSDISGIFAVRFIFVIAVMFTTPFHQMHDNKNSNSCH